MAAFGLSCLSSHQATIAIMVIVRDAINSGETTFDVLTGRR